MKRIIIVGGGGFAFECFMHLKDCCKVDDTISFKGFAAPETPTLSKYGLDSLNLGAEPEIEVDDDDYYVVGISNPQIRKDVISSLKSRGKKLFNLIHPTAMLSDWTREHMGEGNVFCPHSIGHCYKLGDGNVINVFSGLAHDTEVGSYNVLSAACQVNGYATVGDLNFLGAGAIMLPKSKIGNRNKIAAASVVYKSCKDDCVMLGNPARLVGNV